MTFRGMVVVLCALLGTAARADVMVPPGEVEVEVTGASKISMKSGTNVKIKIKLKFNDGHTEEYEVTADKLEEFNLKDGEKCKVDIKVLQMFKIGGGGGAKDGGPGGTGAVTPPPPPTGTTPVRPTEGTLPTPKGAPGVMGPLNFSGTYDPSSFIELTIPTTPPSNIRLQLSGTISGEFAGAEFEDSTKIPIPATFKPNLQLSAPSVPLADGKAETGPMKVTLDPDQPITGFVNFDARTYEALVPIVIDAPNLRQADGSPLKFTEIVTGTFVLNLEPRGGGVTPVTPPPATTPPATTPPATDKTPEKKKTCGDCGVASNGALPPGALLVTLAGALATWGMRRRGRR